MDVVVTGTGLITWNDRAARCALGRGGVRRDKREGDGATPAGRFPILAVRYRPDRVREPATRLPVKALTPADGWCDDPSDVAYNRPVTLPYPARCEALWRDDALYDRLCLIGHNTVPVVPGHGSAIFIHQATPDYAPTEGCVALAPDDLARLLADLAPPAWICITG